MRIIAGTCRSLRLKTPKGLNTRPTTDRIKETLFNILQPQLGNARFLDLYSGSGGIGLEALSRGAKEAVFVENNKEAISCIEENIRFTKMNDRSSTPFMPKKRPNGSRKSAITPKSELSPIFI